MELKQENKFKNLFKRYGVLAIACVFSLTIALSLAIALPQEKEESEPVTTEQTTFALPMTDAEILKDYADDRLQYNTTLDRWQIHLAINFAAEDLSVFSVLDGVVKSVEENSLQGYVITISHDDGFESVYSSLAEDVLVEKGDSVTKGQEIGTASDTASNEAEEGSHLHFELLKDGSLVDPNIYLDLENK